MFLFFSAIITFLKCFFFYTVCQSLNVPLAVVREVIRDMSLYMPTADVKTQMA